ncbi:MAG: hypothetical protein KDC53_05375 [Saprospiraceae bacterium]|nr:hypothetical protein [Saprospiraceae bacterium]
MNNFISAGFLALIFASGIWNPGLSAQIGEQTMKITPNQFQGSDTYRIQAAIQAARGTTNKIFIPAENANGSHIWILDSAILLPAHMTVILNNCTLQLSDNCRDNMFRSDNVGSGIENPAWNENISIIGIGQVFLKGANNPRSTGDSHRVLKLDPEKAQKAGDWRVSYGSDAEKPGMKQKGDWRNIMILMGYVNGFNLKNLNIVNAHAWAVSCERTINAEISNIRFNCPESQMVNGKEVFIFNRDGINLRHGCKNFHIDQITGITGDDFIALSILETQEDNARGGILNSTMVTSRKWQGRQDDTEQIVITNIDCQSKTRAVAIRANAMASINHVYINGLISKDGINVMLVGGKGYGIDSQTGKINNIHAMNIIGGGQSLIQIEEAISDCSFANGVYLGEGDIISYSKIEEIQTSRIQANNLIKM